MTKTSSQKRFKAANEDDKWVHVDKKGFREVDWSLVFVDYLLTFVGGEGGAPALVDSEKLVFLRPEIITNMQKRGDVLQ